MTVNHVVSDLVASLKNGQLAKRKYIVVKGSKLVDNILAVLKEEGYIGNYSDKETKEAGRRVEIELKYFNYKPSIRDIKVISTPGRRVYSGYNDFPKVFNGLGTVVISTPRGIMTDHQAREENVGGELLFKLF